MASKWKKRLKKVAKVAALGALAYGASKLGKRKGKQIPYKNVHKLGVVQDTPGNTLKEWSPGSGGKPHIPKKKWKMPDDPSQWQVYQAKGGRVGKKGGGRTGKQFGGGLGSTARRDMRSGYYPKDMGMRGGTMYKKGGRVKSMGIAKRGGGVAKR